MDDKVFNLLERLYSDFTEFKSDTNKKFDEINEKLDKKTDKTDIVKLEFDIKQDISALYDGYKQNTETLQQIKEEVSRHEEVIIRRVK